LVDFSLLKHFIHLKYEQHLQKIVYESVRVLHK
jgi:hypothetical protein